MIDKKFYMKRREFGKLAFAGLLGGGSLFSRTANSQTVKKNKAFCQIEPGIKLGISGITYPDFDEAQLTFMKELGVTHVEGWMRGENITYEDILNFRNRIARAGLKLYICDSLSLYNSVQVHLGLEGRDRLIRQYQQFIRDLGKAGIRQTVYGWSPSGVYSTGKVKTRGCQARFFDLEEAKKKDPLKYGRVYSDEELWDNYAYFMGKILPVAEDCGVRLAMHPCDPPASMCGAARIFRSTESFKRAMSIADNSKNWGIQFCVGTWGEMPGADGKGEDIAGAIRYFGRRGHIIGVHLRNVSSPLPRFHETFIDNGYIDMYEIIKALAEVGYNGTIVPDHIPLFTDEKRLGPMGVSGTAYTIGYMKALLGSVKGT